MEPNREERKRRRLRAGIAFSLSSAVSLAGAEVVCRAMYGIPIRERLPIMSVVADPRRGYAMIPGTEHYSYERLVRVNGLGLRGADVPERKPESEPSSKPNSKDDETRILCLGDSTTFGQGIAEEVTLPALLERELTVSPRADAQGKVRVVNGGLRGYGTEQELVLLEELGPKIGADVVVLLWYPNDLEKPDIAGTFARLEREGAVAYDTETRLEGMRLWTWYGRQFLRRSAFVMQVHDILASFTAKRMTEEEVDRGFERLDALLPEFARLAKAQGSELLVAAIPTAGMVAAGEKGREIPARVGRLAQEHGLAFVDLFKPLAEEYRRTGKLPLLPYDWHYTGVANAAMARRVAEALRERFPRSF